MSKSYHNNMLKDLINQVECITEDCDNVLCNYFYYLSLLLIFYVSYSQFSYSSTQ